MRPFRSLLAAAVACGALLAGPAAAQTALRMNISVAQNSHYGVAIDTFAREVEKRTNGRYKVQNFYSGALGAEPPVYGHVPNDAPARPKGGAGQGARAILGALPAILEL